MIADYLLIVFCFVIFVNLLITALFCLFMRSKTYSVLKRDKVKSINSKESFKGVLFSYFYGLIRYNSILAGKIPSH